MLGISWAELIIIGVLALIILGPKELPFALKKIGNFFGKLKVFSDEFLGDLNKEIEEPKKYIKDLDGKIQPTYNLDDIKPDNKK